MPACNHRSPRGSHADGSAIDDTWLRTGDLGVYLDGELYITGRIADLLTIDGRNHYPQDIKRPRPPRPRRWCGADT